MTIQINAHQITPADFMTLPVPQADGTFTKSKMDTSFIHNQDVVVYGYEYTSPRVQHIIDSMLAGKEWEGHKPKSIILLK